MIQKKLIGLILLISCVCSLKAQEGLLTLTSKDTSLVFENTSISLTKDRTKEKLLNELIQNYISDNYLEASVDTLWLDTLSDSYIAEIYRGPKYSFENIETDSLPKDLIEELKSNKFSDKQEFIKFRSSVIKRYADNGFPFAKLVLNPKDPQNTELKGYLNLQKGPHIIIDSLQIGEEVKLSKKFLTKYLNIEEASIYNHTKVTKIFSRLQQLNFIEQYKAPDLTFFGNYASINLYLKEKNTSRFDFLFGIIPSTQIQDKSLFLSLDITAELLNKMGNGEYIFVDFERLRPEQQKFEIKFNYPYILNLNYALDLDFSIFRNSLDYQTLSSDIGFQYLFNNNDKIKFSWVYESSDLVEIDSAAIYNSGSLPQDLDISQNGLALELEISRLDYPFNPYKGFSAAVKATAGLKEIHRNSSILQLENEEFNFSNAYDSLDLKSSRFEVLSQLHYFHPLAQRSSLATHIHMGWRYSKSGLFRNEKFQIGGNKLLRGFDEAQFFSSYYGLIGMEYKILLNNNSYLSAPFIDFAILEDSTGNSIWALGIGGGLGIQTKSGQLLFSIAVGRTSELSFDFKRPKAHIGYISLF